LIKLLQDWVTDRASESPDRVAVTCSVETLTYGELDAASNRLARTLREAGARAGDRVGLLLPKSCRAVTALLAAYKADCIAVPLEPTGPAPRLVKILEAAEPSILLACEKTTALLDATLASSAAVRRDTRVGVVSPGALEGEQFRSVFSGSDVERSPARTCSSRRAPPVCPRASRSPTPT